MPWYPKAIIIEKQQINYVPMKTIFITGGGSGIGAASSGNLLMPDVK